MASRKAASRKSHAAVDLSELERLYPRESAVELHVRDGDDGDGNPDHRGDEVVRKKRRPNRGRTAAKDTISPTVLSKNAEREVNRQGRRTRRT